MWLMDYDFSKSNEVRINENPSKNMNLWKNILKIGEKQNFKELWKYGSIMANKKTLIII
jgi:hypothetical protein